MKRILILYFSGVGNTRRVAEYMYSILKENTAADIYSIEQLPEGLCMEDYDRLILGTSTLHSAPPKPLKEYLQNLKKLTKPLPVLIFATYGLYPENTLRRLSNYCLDKNIIPVMHSSYRCAAADGVLLAPGIDFFWHDSKKINIKINCDIQKYLMINSLKPQIPHYKLYGILNFPNKWLGEHIRFKIYVHEDKCVKCGLCIQDCPMHAMGKNKEGYPEINQKNCINCYRCIHHCAQKALSLFRKKVYSHTLYH